jgi:hypothetical protein
LRIEPAVEKEAIPDASAPVLETGISPKDLAPAELGPPTVSVHERSDAVDDPAGTPSVAESDVPRPVTIEMPHVAAPQVEPPVEAAPVEATRDAEAPQENAVSQPDPRAVSAPEDRIDREKAARDALTSDLADMIHSVLSTTQFATKAMKPDRYSSVRSIDEPEPVDIDDGGGIATDALPHPVAIRARLGRLERVLAFASVGMIIVVGYFAFSLWRDEGVVPAQGPVIAAAPSSRDWGERARDVSRGLGAAAIDASTSPSATPQTGSPKSADAPR